MMAGLGPPEPETLDTIITAGITVRRARAVPLSPGHIRERPAHARLRERARQIHNDLLGYFDRS